MNSKSQSGFAGLLLSGLVAVGFAISAYNGMSKASLLAYQSPDLIDVESASQLNQSGLRYAKQLLGDPVRLDALIQRYRDNASVVLACPSGNGSAIALNPTTVVESLAVPASHQEILISAAFRPYDCSKQVSINNYRVAIQVSGGVNCNAPSQTGNSGCISRSLFVSAEKAPGATSCVWALADSDNTLLFNSGNTINGPNCEFHGHGTTTSSVIWNSGNVVELARLLSKGGILSNAPRMSWMEDYAGSAVQADPFAQGLPQPVGLGCTYNNFVANGAVVLNPGVYCGSTSLNANGAAVQMSPGLYVIRNGDFNVNQGDVDAKSGVTIFLESSHRVALNGSSSLKIKAPETGTYAGLALYEKYGLPAGNTYPIDANRGIELEGLVYLPSRRLILNSGSSVQSNALNLVAYSVNFSGTNWNLSPYAGQVAGAVGGSSGDGVQTQAVVGR